MESDLPIKPVEPVGMTNEIVQTGTNDDDLANKINQKFIEDLKKVVNETNGFESFWLKLAFGMSKLTKKLLG